MVATLEYNNDIRKIDVTCDESLTLHSGLFLTFIDALDALNAGEPVELITLVQGIPVTEFDYVLTMKSGVTLTYRLIPAAQTMNFSVTTSGTVWVPERLLLNTNLRRAVVDLILNQGLTALEVDYF